MGYTTRILVAIVVSLLLHAIGGRAMQQLPPQEVQRRPHSVVMQVVRTPPPPEPLPPEPEPEPEPVEPTKPLPVPEIVHEVPRKQPPRARPQRRQPPPDRPPPQRDLPEPNSDAVATDTTDTPVFGFTMESTSAAGAGPAMPVGNTLMAKPEDAPAPKRAGPVKALAPPVPVYEVTKMPTMRGRCRGDYTERARAAGTEGTVVLDLIVGDDGRTRDIRIVEGLPNGLSEAAVAALKRCRFAPGRRGGMAVAVRLRAFKIRFFLDDAD